MTTSKLPDDLEIAPGYTVKCWKNLTLDSDRPDSTDWKKALQILNARIGRRFLDPIDELIRIDEGRPRKMFGFAILAVDFLVIETLQGFREGKTDHSGKSKKLFTNFLKQWNAFTVCLPPCGKPNEFAARVYRDYRCALHHSGATEGALRVGVSGAMFNFKNSHEVKINRTCLHKNLKKEFERYVHELRRRSSNEPRCNFKKKMDAICGINAH